MISAPGSIPSWLGGDFYLNGPGLFEIGQDQFKTLFDGMAVLQQFQIRDGQVHYRSRHIDSETLKRNRSANRIVVHEFGTLGYPDPCESILTRYTSYLFDTIRSPTDNTVVNVINFNNHLYALTETPRVNEISPDSLETVQHIEVKSSVPIHILTAHPIKESHDTMWNIGTSFGFNSSYCILKIKSEGDKNPFSRIKIVSEIPARWGLKPSYYHSFGMSENYIVLIEQPLCLPIMQMVSAPFRRKSFLELIEDNPTEECIFHIIHKQSGDLLSTKYVTDSFLILHHINSYEENGNLVVDICAFKDTRSLHLYTLKNIEISSTELPLPEIWRFVLPLNTTDLSDSASSSRIDGAEAPSGVEVQEDGSKYCSPQIFFGASLELPAISECRLGRKYRFVYGINMKNFDTAELVKFDFETGKSLKWFEHGYIATTPTFIARPNSTKEDDGCVLSMVISTHEDLPSFHLILNGESMTEIARAKIPLGVRVAYTFHSMFQLNNGLES